MKKKLFLNLSAVALSNIFVRFLGMAYKVWLASVISPVALGVYQLSMSVYSVFITPIASGLPNATSRLSAKYLRENKEYSVLASALKIAAVPLVFSALIMVLGKDLIAGLFLHEREAGNVILALVPAVTLGAVASLPCGVLHARGKSYVSAIFEIIEQVGKIFFAFLIIKVFKISSAVAPALAVSFGGILSFLMFFPYIKRAKNPVFVRETLENALPPTLARGATTLLHLGTTTILPVCLMSFGLSKEAALSQYGILTSMAYPVVFVPMTVIGALCVVILPEIAKNLSDKKIIAHKAKMAFLISLAVTVAFSLCLLLFAPWFAQEVFENPLAGRFMVLLIPSVIFLGLSQVSRTVLNGMGRQKTLMITSIIDGSVGLVLTFILASKFGIYGFILGNCLQDLIAFFVNFVLCVGAVKKN